MKILRPPILRSSSPIWLALCVFMYVLDDRFHTAFCELLMYRTCRTSCQAAALSSSTFGYTSISRVQKEMSSVRFSAWHTSKPNSGIRVLGLRKAVDHFENQGANLDRVPASARWMIEAFFGF